MSDNKQLKIMSGDYSRDMWKAINTSNTIEDLRDALYLVCCRLQELETKYDNTEVFKSFVEGTKEKE